MKQKRMIYIYEENMEFYDALDNKSEFINEAIRQKRETSDALRIVPGDNTGTDVGYVEDEIRRMDEERRLARIQAHSPGRDPGMDGV